MGPKGASKTMFSKTEFNFHFAPRHAKLAFTLAAASKFIIEELQIPFRHFIISLFNKLQTKSRLFIIQLGSYILHI